ncbi:MAG: TIGR03790 family protein [Acidobacteria bacterium]|nr:TIGR03790 family protein [Acidobacteriota bacterium]
MANSVAQDNVLLVVNESSRESTAIGSYYSAKRGITNICRIHTSESETISREAFSREILHPIADHISHRSLQDRIHYIVTTRGIPLTLADDQSSVDSELTLVYRYLLTGSFPYMGRIENPYFAVADNLRPFLRKDFDIYLVTRLTDLALVDRALMPETGGDFYFDMTSPQESMESDWVQQAAAVLKKTGFAVTVENTAKPLDNLISVQGYVSQDPAAVPVIKWRSGAIATILDKDASQSAAAYITGGVTGFGSYTGDPMQDGYFRPSILFKAYTEGYNLAESFYASTRYLSSRQVVIGDPLVAPYAKSQHAKEEASLDSETGLPEHFARRRIDYLMWKYPTSREAAVLLLKAESAETRGDHDTTLALAAKSLESDPLFTEAEKLKSRLNEKPEVAANPEPKPAASAALELIAEPEPEPAPTEPEVLNYPCRLISQTPIDYPMTARQAKAAGEVVVSLLIDEMGQVMKAEVIHGDRRLAKAILESVKLWRFEPELQNGRPVVCTHTLPISFKSKNNW